MTKRDEEEFSLAVRKLPQPVSCFSDGACCPWCGGISGTVTFGMNACVECEKPYAFGYPDWHAGKDPVSWVPFPFSEFFALGSSAELIPDFHPNKRLLEIYFQQAEESLGIHADTARPN
jgi:hypothetical protein